MLFWDAAVHETLCWGIPCRRPAAATNIRGATVSMRPAPLPRPPLDFGARLSGGQPIAKLRAHAHCRMALVRRRGARFAGTTGMGENGRKTRRPFPARSTDTAHFKNGLARVHWVRQHSPGTEGSYGGRARLGGQCSRRKINVVGFKLGWIWYPDCIAVLRNKHDKMRK